MKGTDQLVADQPLTVQTCCDSHRNLLRQPQSGTSRTLCFSILHSYIPGRIMHLLFGTKPLIKPNTQASLAGPRAVNLLPRHRKIVSQHQNTLSSFVLDWKT